MKLRRARPGDAADIAVIHRQAMRVSLAFLPELHTAEEDLAFMHDRLLPENEVWVAETDGRPAGYIAFKPGWVEHLFVHPDFQKQRAGTLLLAKALEDGATRRLWTFQQNERARRFYEKHGFVPETFTEGEGNEERMPDVCYVRPGGAQAL